MEAAPTLGSQEPISRPILRRLDLPYLIQVGGLVAVYFLTARLGLTMDAVSGFATTVWPPTGIALVALTLFGVRLWPGIALGAFLVNGSVGASLLTASGMAVGNTLEAVIGVWMLRRFVGSREIFDRVPGVVAFVVFVAGLSTMVSASIGVLSGWVGGVISTARAGEAWLTWWLGDAMGNLILAPALFVWLESPRHMPGLRRAAEGVGLLTALLLVCQLVFGPANQPLYLQPYVIFPFLMWASLRFRRLGTVTATLIVASMAVRGTAAGFGPFARGTVNESLLLLQVFMAVVAVTMLVFDAGLAERRLAEMRVRLNYSVTRVLADATSMAEAIPRILSAISESLEWDCACVWIVDTATGTMRYGSEWHRPASGLEDFAHSAEGVTFKPGVGIAGRVWSGGRPIWVPNLALETNAVRAELALAAGLQSFMGFPIFVGREVHGVMTFFGRRVRPPDELLRQMMETLGSQIGEFMQRQKSEAELRAAHADLEVRIARRTEQLSRTNRALEEEIAEKKQAEAWLRELSTRLLRIQDEERQRLARELHDSTAQTLAALSMNLAVAQESRDKLSGRARQAIDESEMLADLCSREIRSMSYLLHPPLLKEVGLPAAVRWCAEGFARRSGLEVEVQLPGDFGRLPIDVENALFRIVQECLTNVQRHSGSPSAQIQLSRNSRSVVLEVRDQGRGMADDILNHYDGVGSLGVGLLGMRERVRQLGGQMRIESSDKGSTVHVEIDAEARPS